MERIVVYDGKMAAAELQGLYDNGAAALDTLSAAGLIGSSAALAQTLAPVADVAEFDADGNWMFGRAISQNGNVLAIGAPGAKDEPGVSIAEDQENIGRVYIWQQQPDGSYAEHGG